MRIAVAQMAGEELGIPRRQRITVIDGDTGLCPDQGGTGGSTRPDERRDGCPSGRGDRAAGIARAGRRRV